MALGGRPEEENGHKRRNLSFNKLTNEAFDKIKKEGGNISQYIEKALKPELENLDPGEASIHIWRYETYLNQRISEALIEDKPGKAKALTSILVALKDFRSLSGIPPLDPQLLSTETTPLKKEPSIFKGLGFFDWLERRAERKRLEHERELLELEAERYALREEILMREAKYNSEALEERAKRRQKYREILKRS